MAEPGGLFKIGKSSDPERRRSQLLPQWPGLRVIHMIRTEAMFAVEKAIHLRYVRRRVIGEWFRLNDEEVNEIRALSRLTGPVSLPWYRDAGQKNPSGLFGEIVQNAIIRAGVTQQEVAEAIGIHQTLVSKITRQGNQKNARTDAATVIALCRLLSLDLVAMLNLLVPPEKPSPAPGEGKAKRKAK
jgi:plasmid maintenance system antidote protein VapI